MKYNGEIDIAEGPNIRSKKWKNKKIKWSKLVSKLKEENRLQITYKEYISATKQEQLQIKDVGGYVGGYIRGGRRKPENVVYRQLATLDIDFAHLDFWDDFCLQYDNAALIHSTLKHSESRPRFRLVFPLSREATPDEYVAVTRKIAGDLGIDLFDNTTFEISRLMFWPATTKDGDHFFEVQDGPWIDVDEVLNTYSDWTDTSLWPTSKKSFDDVNRLVKKQEDPEDKKSIVGAFCRTYTVTDAIKKFLSETYAETAQSDRFTYIKGSTSSGLIVYDDKFAFSHHGSDPSGGRLCNAFDLVRIHKFGHLDEESKTTKPLSFTKMTEFALADKEVKKLMAAENLAEVKYDFADDGFDSYEEDVDWMQELETDTRGKYLSTATNLNIIFSNDPRLKGVFKHNKFDDKRYVFANLPWRRVEKPEPVKNVDYAGVRNYIESIYGIVGNLKIEDAMSLEFEKRSFHPILEYLHNLEWDNTPRVDTILIDYFGAEDNIYTREAIRKMLVGAVGRVYKPGIKFDLVLTLVGKQGTGKSTFIKKLGGKWFSDTFLTVQGKEALEQIQGAWIIEMAELSGLRKAEVESVKHFISKQEDTFRPAYARVTETYPRQCVFFGTTNNKDFLRDPTGNRRFIPVDIVPERATKCVFKDLTQKEVDQIWAEAVVMYKAGEKLYMSDNAAKMAVEEQKRHSEVDERKGIIEAYLETLLPENWDEMDIYQRRIYFEDDLAERGTVERDYVCIAEIWCECLGKNKEDMDRYKTRELNDIMRSLEEWEQSKSTKNFPNYGKQKYYVRKIENIKKNLV